MKLKGSIFFVFIVFITLAACQKTSDVQHEADVQLIKDYIAQNNISAVHDVDTDIYYQLISSTATDTIRPLRLIGLNLVINYDIKLLDGTLIYDTQGSPNTIAMDDAIYGWQLIFTKMSIGDKMLVFIPSRLAYGEEGQTNYNIPTNSVLMCTIELLEIFPHF